MREIVTRLYKFEELDAEAQERAITDYSRADTDFYNAEDIIYDATSLLEAWGFRNAKVYYSGFYSQGDGASFIGEYYPADIDLVKWARENYPQDTDLSEIAGQLQEVLDATNYEVYAEIRHIGHYVHEYSMDIDAYSDQYDDDGVRIDLTQEQSDAIKDAFRSLAQWIYARLENDDYEHSEEYIREQIIANDYEFTENGAMH